jgi:hypothetical protein
MMTYIKRTGRALMVALAIIVVEPAAAEAAKNPVMVNPKGEAVTNLKVTADSGTVSVVSTAPSGAMLDCEPSEGVGTLSTRPEGTGETSGTGTVTFKGCKTGAGEGVRLTV